MDEGRQIVRRVGDGRVAFRCPGCGTFHVLSVEAPAPNGARWSWNGSLDRPTFAPSILAKGTLENTDEELAAIARGELQPVDYVCHSFVEDGMIRFLGDCSHKLADKTVPLEPC